MLKAYENMTYDKMYQINTCTCIRMVNTKFWIILTLLFGQKGSYDKGGTHRVYSKKKFLGQEGANWEDGRPNLQVHPSLKWTDWGTGLKCTTQSNIICILCMSPQVQSSSCFHVKGKGKWEGREETDDCRQLGTSRGPRKIVLSLLTLTDVSLVMRLLQIFDKQYNFPYLLGEALFDKGLFLLKLKPPSRIPLMITMSICNRLFT